MEEVRGIPRRMLKTGPNISTSGNLKSQIETERPQRDTLEKTQEDRISDY